MHLVLSEYTVVHVMLLSENIAKQLSHHYFFMFLIVLLCVCHASMQRIILINIFSRCAMGRHRTKQGQMPRSCKTRGPPSSPDASSVQLTLLWILWLHSGQTSTGTKSRALQVSKRQLSIQESGGREGQIVRERENSSMLMARKR